MSDRGIKMALINLLGLNHIDPVTYVDAVVSSVDVDARTCVCVVTVGRTEYQLPDVRLIPVVDDGLFIEPAIDSNVKVLMSVNNEPFVCQFSEIENITISANTLVSLNDGSFGGMVKIADLVEKLNALENDINTLKTAFASWAPTGTLADGTLLKTATTSWSAQSLTPTQQSELENTMIVHGE